MLFAVSLFSASCRPPESERPKNEKDRGVTGNPGTIADSGNPEFASRLGAAKGIVDTVARDDALSKLAIDSATGSDGENARKAIEAISDQVMKDQIASQSALKLAKSGKGEDANAVARLISDSVARDKTLSRIAKGEIGD